MFICELGKDGVFTTSSPAAQADTGVHTNLEFSTKVHRLVLTNELSKRAARDKYNLSWGTLQKILTHVEPPGYHLRQPRPKRKMEPLLPFISQILEAEPQAPRKQMHTAQRIFDRLRDEQSYTGATPPSRRRSGTGSSLTGKSICRCRIRRGKPRSITAKRPSS